MADEQSAAEPTDQDQVGPMAPQKDALPQNYLSRSLNSVSSKTQQEGYVAPEATGPTKVQVLGLTACALIGFLGKAGIIT